MNNNNNLELEQIALEPEVIEPLPYDFEFITATLNLIPILKGTAAINLTSITDIERDENGDWVIGLENDSEYTLSDSDMAELEKNLRRRIEDNKTRTKENMKDNARLQSEVMAELQSGVQQAPGVIVNSRGRKGFH